WELRALRKMLKAAKGLTNFTILDFLKKHLLGTKLIFVLGKTGTGKTSLLQELVGQDLHVGHSLESGTRHYEVIPALIHGEKYLFVDTAGFGARDMDDKSNFENIMSCLVAFGPFVTIAGVLFLHSSKEDRMTNDEVKTVQWLQCFCGPEFFQNITIVTTKWDTYNSKSFQRAREQLQNLTNGEDIGAILHPPDPYVGASLYNHGIPGGGVSDSWGDPLDIDDDRSERAAEIGKVIQQLHRNPAPAQLQVNREMEEGKDIMETTAAKAL
ncbi:hypothetical protein K432DRAFT_270626, partial [Lepidopterella palustris CBS 459.81]